MEKESTEELTEKPKEETKVNSNSGGSKAFPKMVLLFGVIISIGVGLVFWKNTVLAHHPELSNDISKEEIELLLKDFPPMQRKQIAENPKMKSDLVDNLTELLAIAAEAKKVGYANKPLFHKELEFTKKAVYASNYDKKVNSDKGPMPPFGFISEDMVNEFWGNGKDMSGLNWIWNGADNRRNDAEFQQFLEVKLELGRKAGRIPKDKEPSEQELSEAKNAFAKTMIYYKESLEKLDDLSSLPDDEREDWENWKTVADLQVKLQEAQFLTQNYVQDVLSKDFVVTDKDVKKYFEENPELDVREKKKTLANEVIQKVKDGGDFAELATEYSEDPGSKNKGGLYEGIGKGQFAPEFESTALSLKPGEIANHVVETQFGYHIIKLEKINEVKGKDGKTTQTYDVRHILFSTMIKDPDNPAAREQPVEQFAKGKLQKSKQRQVLDEVIKNNPVHVADDFEVPEVSEEELEKQKEAQMKQMQQRMKQQKRNPQTAKPPAPPKNEAKKEGKPKANEPAKK